MNRKLYFKYELYDKDNVFKKRLFTVIDATVTYSSLSRLKASAIVTMTEDNDVDYLHDQIKIICNIDGVDYPVGQYLISSPIREINNLGVTRKCDCYSKLLILDEEKTEIRHYIPKGTNVVNEIKRLITNKYITLIDASLLTTSTDKEYEIGTPLLDIINDLLAIINFTSLRVDNNGNFIATPYILPTDRQIDITYEANEISIIYDGMQESIDMFNIPNVVIRYTNNGDITPPLYVKYENNNVSSETSTVKMGRKITDSEEVTDVANQNTLNDICKRDAYNLSDKYTHVEFQTAINPIHGYLDCIYLKAYDINSQFIETSWEMNCMTGGNMKHTVRKVINI